MLLCSHCPHYLIYATRIHVFFDGVPVSSIFSHSGIHPVCTPCLNSAKLYQEDPQCEWGGSAKPEDSSKNEAKVKQEEEQPAAALNLPPLVLASLNPHIAADTASYYTRYDPSYGSYVSSSNGLGDQSYSQSEISGISDKASKRKNVKRDHNSLEVEALLARVAELEARLQAANMESSSQPSQTSLQSNLDSGNHAGAAGSTAHQAPHVHFQLQDPSTVQWQTSSAGMDNLGASSNASSVDMTTSAGNGLPNSNSTSRQGTATISISPFSSNGLPTPPSSTSAATGGGGGYPSSPASNASRGSANQDGSHVPLSGAHQQQQSGTSYFTKSSLGQYQDPKWNMGAIPGYLNMTPPMSQPQSPFGPGNLVSIGSRPVVHIHWR